MKRKKLPHDPRFSKVSYYHTDVRATIRREQQRLKALKEEAERNEAEALKKVKPFKQKV